MAFGDVEIRESEEETGEGEETLDLESLRSQLEQERRAREAAEQERERERSRLDAWLQGRGESERAPATPPLGAAPDPTEDPERFRTWIAERDRRAAEELDRRLERQQRETEERIGMASRQATLWQLFQTRYPKHAERTDLASTAFQRVVQRGVLDRSDDSGVVDAVRKEMDSIVGAPIDKIGAPDGDRTRGLSVGDRGTAKKPARAPITDEPKTLHESISKRQLEFGLI